MKEGIKLIKVRNPHMGIISCELVQEYDRGDNNW